MKHRLFFRGVGGPLNAPRNADCRRSLLDWCFAMGKEYLAILSDGKQRHEFRLNGGPINNPDGAQAVFLALGLGAASWARLEQHIDAVLMQVNKEQHSTEILSLFNPDHPLPFTDKIRLLKRYFNKHPALKEHTEAIRSFAKVAKILGQERNIYLHGILERYDSETKTIFIRSVKPLHDPKNPYAFGIAAYSVPLETLQSFAEFANKANDHLEEISRALFTPDAVARLRKPGPPNRG